MVLIGDVMAGVLIAEYFRLYVHGSKNMPGCDKCAALKGFESYKHGERAFPEKYVRPGEKPTGKRVDIIFDPTALKAYEIGVIISFVNGNQLPMPQDMKDALKKDFAECEFGDNCYILDALGRGE